MYKSLSFLQLLPLPQIRDYTLAGDCSWPSNMHQQWLWGILRDQATPAAVMSLQSPVSLYSVTQHTHPRERTDPWPKDSRGLLPSSSCCQMLGVRAWLCTCCVQYKYTVYDGLHACLQCSVDLSAVPAPCSHIHAMMQCFPCSDALCFQTLRPSKLCRLAVYICFSLEGIWTALL